MWIRKIYFPQRKDVQKMTMRLVSWNVNGIRAASRNGLIGFVEKNDFDVIMLQEIKAEGDQIPEELLQKNYSMKAFPAERKGYSGVLSMFRKEPVSIRNGMGSKKYDSEGRVQVLEYESAFMINAYFPNSQRGLTRLEDKLEFNRLFLDFCEGLRKEKPVIVCGDFNVAHEEIDIARPKDNRRNAGFTDEERSWMTDFLSDGYKDTFRMFNSEGGKYSWWTYRFNARERNVGWRIDYFIVSDELESKVVSAGILDEVMGSDHAPVFLEIDL